MEYKTLDELFKKWKEAHKSEDDESCKKTFPKKAGESPDISDFKSSFCPDGFLSDKKFNGVLIIQREPNVFDKGEGKCIAETNYFWFRDGNKENDSTLKHYRNNANKYLHQLIGEDYTLEECAYMNLNKRGGYGSTNNTQLNNYVYKNNYNYQEYIANEIKIIKPTHIICCGVYGTIEKQFADSIGERTYIFDCYHLSYSNLKCKHIAKKENGKVQVVSNKEETIR